MFHVEGQQWTHAPPFTFHMFFGATQSVPVLWVFAVVPCEYFNPEFGILLSHSRPIHFLTHMDVTLAEQDGFPSYPAGVDTGSRFHFLNIKNDFLMNTDEHSLLQSMAAIVLVNSVPDALKRSETGRGTNERRVTWRGSIITWS